MDQKQCPNERAGLLFLFKNYFQGYLSTFKELFRYHSSGIHALLPGNVGENLPCSIPVLVFQTPQALNKLL